MTTQVIAFCQTGLLVDGAFLAFYLVKGIIGQVRYYRELQEGNLRLQAAFNELTGFSYLSDEGPEMPPTPLGWNHQPPELMGPRSIEVTRLQEE